MSQNWRTEVDAVDYLGHRQKQLQVADRRPVIRKAGDLVGPGIGAGAVTLTDFNDQLATYNGFFAADIGAANAPNSIEAFTGTVIMHPSIGGMQEFIGLTTQTRYTRILKRHPLDPEFILRDQWVTHWREQAGRVTTNAITAGTAWTTITPAPIVFNPPFPIAPEIVLQNRSAFSGYEFIYLAPVAVTATGFGIQGKCSIDRAGQSVSWQAIPATPAAV